MSKMTRGCFSLDCLCGYPGQTSPTLGGGSFELLRVAHGTGQQCSLLSLINFSCYQRKEGKKKKRQPLATSSPNGRLME